MSPILCTLLLLGVGGALAQYDFESGPLPPRPIIPGAIPLGAIPVRRPVLRVQQQNRRLLPDQEPPQRARRPIVRGGRERDSLPPSLRGRDSLPLLPPPTLALRGGRERERETLPPLPPPEPVTIPPRPVIEEIEENLQIEDITTLPPFRPAVFRPIEEPARPQFEPPQFNRQTARPPLQEDVQPQQQPPLQKFRPSLLEQPQPQRIRPLILEQTPQKNRFPALDQLPQRIRPQPQPQPQQEPQQRPRPQRPLEQPQRTRPAQQSEQQQPPRQQQGYRQQQQQQVVQAPEKQYSKSSNRVRKPTAQVLKKYREDNADGSITWGFENDDGTYKEETIGVDCVTRGKYGYIDPDGVRREFSYSSGLPCDKTKDNDGQGTEQGYIDYTNNRYVFPNGDSVDLSGMVKNRARKPVYRN